MLQGGERPGAGLDLVEYDDGLSRGHERGELGVGQVLHERGGIGAVVEQAAVLGLRIEVDVDRVPVVLTGEAQQGVRLPDLTAALHEESSLRAFLLPAEELLPYLALHDRKYASEYISFANNVNVCK